MTTPIETSDRWIEPIPASGSDEAPIPADQVARWRSAGVAVVDGVVPADAVEALAMEARDRFPEPGSDASRDVVGFGSGGAFVFPATAAFNTVTLHPRLLAAVAQLLGTAVADLRLTQSDLWPKYGRAEKLHGAFDAQDQRIHVDYPNHMLAHPAPWDRPEAVEMILYLSDVDECGGPTAVVAREGEDDPAYPWPIVDSPGIGELPYLNDREAAEAHMAAHRPESVPGR